MTVGNGKVGLQTPVTDATIPKGKDAVISWRIDTVTNSSMVQFHLIRNLIIFVAIEVV
jgi:hypothetical protein